MLLQLSHEKLYSIQDLISNEIKDGSQEVHTTVLNYDILNEYKMCTKLLNVNHYFTIF